MQKGKFASVCGGIAAGWLIAASLHWTDAAPSPAPPPDTGTPSVSREPVYNAGEELAAYCAQGTVAAPRHFAQPPGLRLPPEAPLLSEALDQCPPGSECSAETAEIQFLLLGLGFDPGPMDGFAGPRTQSAIQAYICAFRLPPWYATAGNDFLRRQMRAQALLTSQGSR